MLSRYLARQLARAQYKILEDGTYYGEIPGIRGVWASGRSLERCREELREVLEDWLLLKLRDHEAVPGLRLPRRRSVRAYA
ncbi:MAG: type II toxin-antitoxin system HicB family antitoxin [Candidatus Uhrbacteria bacterium]